MIYLDTSAILKTVFDEPQSPAVRRYLEASDDRRFVSSTLLAVEARRGVLRANPRRLPQRMLTAVAAHSVPTASPV